MASNLTYPLVLQCQALRVPGGGENQEVRMKNYKYTPVLNCESQYHSFIHMMQNDANTYKWHLHCAVWMYIGMTIAM